MNENSEKFPDYVTYARTFEKYKWYRPLLVIIIAAVIFFILQLVVVGVLGVFYGWDYIVSLAQGGYNTLTSEAGSLVGFLTIVTFVPSLFIASRIVKDRPFSSYSSSRGGWNWKLYFKCLVIPLIIYVVFNVVSVLIFGRKGHYSLTLPILLISIFIVPMQCIAEEYMVRGLIMQTLGAWFKIPIVAVVIQAVIFALMHPYNLLGVIGIFIEGLVFGFLAWKSNGLEVGSALHSVNNFSSSIFAALGFDLVSSVITPVDFAADLFVSLVSAVVLYYVASKQGWFN